VERRAAKEQNLRNAAEVWKKARGALAATCDSLSKHYSPIARVKHSQSNRNLITITITRSHLSARRNQQAYRTSVVSIEFQPEQPTIIVTIDGVKTQEFPIAADSDHAFIALHGSELIPDEFSRLALEEVFFSQTEPAESSQKLRLVR
jgi:hypothetical protein